MREKAFTLIELLVVISITALLLAILMPTLRRVRNQARSVVCQSNLRQWGTLLQMYINDNNGLLPRSVTYNHVDDESTNAQFDHWWLFVYLDPQGQAKQLHCCPQATKLANPTDGASPVGGTFMAWGRLFSIRKTNFGSYGFNQSAACTEEMENSEYLKPRVWRRYQVSGNDRIPMFFDSAWPIVDAWYGFNGSLPEYDAIPDLTSRSPPAFRHSCCINRHNGTVNALFLDGGTRNVGLKELWTLKWHKLYSMRNQYTKAGGMKPEDWPQWMQNFKDY